MPSLEELAQILGYTITGSVALFNLAAVIGYKKPFLEFGFDSRAVVRDYGKTNTFLNPPQIKDSPLLSSQIKVMTANLAGGRGRSFHHFDHLLVCDLVGYHRWMGDISQQGIEGIEQLLSSEEVDVAFFQEIQRGAARGDDQITQLSKKAYYAFRPNVTHRFLANWDLDHGDAIASTIPLSQIQGVSFKPFSPIGFNTITNCYVGSKGFIRAKITYQDQPVYLYTTHFSSLPRSQAARAAEARALINDIALDHFPAIVAGDFNTVPTGSQLREFPTTGFGSGRRKWRAKYAGDRTWMVIQEVLECNQLALSYNLDLPLFASPSDKFVPGTYIGSIPTVNLGQPLQYPDWGERIDYLLAVNKIGHPLQARLVSEQVHHQLAYSDHLPVSAVIELG